MIHLFFRRSQETDQAHYKNNEAYITFYSPRVGGIPPKIAPNHFRLPLTKISLYHRIVGILRVIEYEMGDRKVVVHFGWPLSSWLDRMSIGVMVYNLMKLPSLFPKFNFDIQYGRELPASRKKITGHQTSLPALNNRKWGKRSNRWRIDYRRVNEESWEGKSLRKSREFMTRRIGYRAEFR